MLKGKFYLILLLLALNCQQNKLVNNISFIKNLSNDTNFKLPLKNGNIKIFFIKDNYFYETSLTILHHIMMNEFKNYNDFDLFLEKVINENLLTTSIVQKYYYSVFKHKISETIFLEYEKKGIKFMKEKYCFFNKKFNTWEIKSNISTNNCQNIMYIFFKNNYYIYEGDINSGYLLYEFND